MLGKSACPPYPAISQTCQLETLAGRANAFGFLSYWRINQLYLKVNLFRLFYDFIQLISNDFNLYALALEQIPRLRHLTVLHDRIKNF